MFSANLKFHIDSQVVKTPVILLDYLPYAVVGKIPNLFLLALTKAFAGPSYNFRIVGLYESLRLKF